jgi:hypothetical protein
MIPFTALLVAATIAPDAPQVEYKQPQIALSEKLVGITFGSGNVVYFAGSKDGGQTFSSPAEVSRPGKLALGRHRGPRIAIAGNTIVVSAITGEKLGGIDGDLTAWRSTDGGRTWSAGVRVNDVPAAAREGLHAMAAADGIVFATWLDLRDKGTVLYGAVSRDGGATWSKNRVVYASGDGHICECCHPSALVSGGKIYAMWRNWLSGSRDMWAAVSSDEGETFQGARKLGAGTWPLKGCPMDGGGIAMDAGKLVSAWRREGSIFVAPVDGDEREIGKGKDPAIAAGRDGVFVVWSSSEGLRAALPGKPESAVLDPLGAYAAVAGNGTAVAAAWESGGEIRVQRLNPETRAGFAGQAQSRSR